MKKTFLPLGIIRVVAFIFWTLFCGVIVASFIYTINSKQFIYLLVITLPLTLFCVVVFVWIFYNKIIFTEDKIIIKEDKIPDKNMKTQYKDEIFFEDIVDVKMVMSRNKNSLKKWYSENHYRHKKIFFNVILKEQESKWVCVYPFSIKQRKKMLQIINEKTGLNIDYDDIFANREEIDVGIT